MFGYMNGYQEEVFLKQIGLHDKKMLTIKVSIVANKTAVGGGFSMEFNPRNLPDIVV